MLQDPEMGQQIAQRITSILGHGSSLRLWTPSLNTNTKQYITGRNKVLSTVNTKDLVFLTGEYKWQFQKDTWRLTGGIFRESLNGEKFLNSSFRLFYHI